MEKIVTIRCCCDIFFNLQMDRKLPNVELLEVTTPDFFCERTIQLCKIPQIVFQWNSCTFQTHSFISYVISP